MLNFLNIFRKKKTNISKNTKLINNHEDKDSIDKRLILNVLPKIQEHIGGYIFSLRDLKLDNGEYINVKGNTKYIYFIFRERSVVTYLDEKNDFITKYYVEECPVCFDNKEIKYIQCGHGICLNCSKKIDKCPVCRKQIKKKCIFKRSEVSTIKNCLLKLDYLKYVEYMSYINNSNNFQIIL